jgi:hypothetical protein
MSISETLGVGIVGNSRVLVTQAPGKEGTFGQFVYPIDLGREFTAQGKRHRVVATTDTHGLRALILEGPEKDYIIHFTPRVKVEDVTPRTL